MHDEGEVGADGQIRNGDKVRPRLLQELQGLDKTEKLLANPAVQHKLGHRYPGQEMHQSTVVVGHQKKQSDKQRRVRRGKMEILVDYLVENTNRQGLFTVETLLSCVVNVLHTLTISR